MTERSRTLIFRVMNEVPQTLPFIHQIQAGFKRGDLMLEWLVKQGLIGHRFLQFAKDNGGSKLRMGSYILRGLERDRKRVLTIKDLR